MEMEGVCVKPPRKAKKNKNKQRVKLEKIPEEELSTTTDTQQICQDAASAVVSEITAKLVDSFVRDFPNNKSSLKGETLEYSNDPKRTEECKTQDEIPSTTIQTESINEIKGLLDSIIEKIEAKIPDPIAKNDSYTHEIQEVARELNTVKPSVSQAIHPDAVFEEPCRPTQLTLNVAGNEYDWNKSFDSCVHKNESNHKELQWVPKNDTATQCTTTTEVFHPKEKCDTDILKPSVFVGKSRPYSSSLDIGYQWDRKKFNPVLLPDLSKVVYPDLDFNFDKNRIQTKAQQNIKIDRSCKPVHHVDTTEKHNTTEPTPEKIFQANLNEILDSREGEVRSQDNNGALEFTEYYLNNNIHLKVFLNPIVWDPMEDQQLVLFKANEVFYEEFFSHCKTTENFIQAIKERAELLTEQQYLLQAKKFEQGGTNHLPPRQFWLHNFDLLTIHTFPSYFDPTTRKQRILFQVNTIFYEEEFANCESSESLLNAIKKRAKYLSRYQEKLELRTKGLVPGVDPVSSSENDNNEVGLIDSLIRPHGHRIKAKEVVGKNENDNASKERHSSESRGSQKQNVFSSFRNWLKGTFGKKSITKRESAPTISNSNMPIELYNSGSAGSSVEISSISDGTTTSLTPTDSDLHFRSQGTTTYVPRPLNNTKRTTLAKLFRR